jgi:type VI secretion system secreted protein Hcp
MERVMSAYMKLGDVRGEATAKNFRGWILLESLVNVAGAAKAQGNPGIRLDPDPVGRFAMEPHKPGKSGLVLRLPEERKLELDDVSADIAIVRLLDCSSVKLYGACVRKRVFDDAEINFCSQVDGEQVPYFTYEMKGAQVSGYTSVFTAGGIPLPYEELQINFESVRLIYHALNPKTGRPARKIMARHKNKRSSS